MSLKRNKLIFIGIDGTGKTPLIEEMKKAVLFDDTALTLIQPAFSVTVKQLVPDPFKYAPGKTIDVAIEEFEVWSSYQDTYVEKTELVLYDRFPIPDELVYGTTELGVNEFNAIDKVVRENAAFVYIEPIDGEEYRKLMAENPDPMFSTHELIEYDRIIRKYHNYLKKTGATVVKVPWYPGVMYSEVDAIRILSELQVR